MNKAFIVIVSLLTFQVLSAQTFDVQHYTINLKVPNSYNTYIEGHAFVDITSLDNNVSQIQLMLQSLTVDSVKVGSTLLSYTHNDTLLDIALNQTLQISDLLQIEVFYHGNAQADPTGWGGYLSMSGYAFNLGVSMAEDPHVYGRVWFPCVDNFTDRATYTFNVTCQELRTAVCGGTLTSEINNGDGTKTYRWELNSEIPTYLASVAVGNYQVYRDTFNALLGEVPVAIYARSTEINNVATSFSHLEQVFASFENRFGPYRWSRVGFVGVPFTGGAMEHAENIAYPNSSIDGTLNSESLYAHELSHHWFGNLITCSQAGDMWINEGWASYCESIFTESLYGTDAYKNYNRDRHQSNLQFLHFNEGQFWPLYDIPTDLTYSSHIYEKGADVAHSLRGFLGDELFFSSLKNFLTDHQFQSISSYDLRDYLTANTPYNLDGFFDSWVFSGGWMHFSVDSFIVNPNNSEFDVEVFIKQKLKGKSNYGVNNRIPIQFLGAQFERLDTVITVSGMSDSQTFTIPFQPYTVICDLDEQIADATTDYYSIIKNPSSIFYQKALFKTDITQVTDSVLLRVEHNWVAPDEFKTPIEGLEIHNGRYWKIEGLFNSNFVANGQFYYSKSSSEHLDDEFVSTSLDSLVLLYRANASEDWQIIPHTRTGTFNSGYMIVDQLQRGEYAFGIWDHHVGIKSEKIENDIRIFPNPANDKLNIDTQNQDMIQEMTLKNIKGEELIVSYPNSNKIVLDISKFPKGMYLIQIKTNTKRIERKLVKS